VKGDRGGQTWPVLRSVGPRPATKLERWMEMIFQKEGEMLISRRRPTCEGRVGTMRMSRLVAAKTLQRLGAARVPPRVGRIARAQFIVRWKGSNRGIWVEGNQEG